MKRTMTGRAAALLLVVSATAAATAACGGSSSGGGTAQNAAGGIVATPQDSSTSAADDTGATPTASDTSAISPSSAPRTTATTARTGSAIKSGYAPCTTADLGNGAWTAVPASGGAGHTSSDISFQNTSTRTCTVTGFPGIVLRDQHGNPLPTHVSHATTSATAVTVAPGGWIHSELRYSSDVPGTGEPQDGSPCEPNTETATVTIPGDTHVVTVTLDAPTPVCGQGSVVAKAFAPLQSSPAGG